ncbi:hypothetical protein [Companilactobacillus kimchii]|uniref:Transposase n=2 Tax=Companilactobacillus kimchii TaxID=2801452 RepID=A0ABR5NUV6_9LACO|nr:hypothetical protein [Companilactobacillus kimchii]KAE9557380.1 hypothetical protein ATN91_04345 [Companilactobacillus kimchii]KRK52488.1 hypothetical protein FC97_GL000290 [Companilactobacillus kimchii DSM 13961 = JCM 10707]OWF32606.1 hypothetical protein LKACC12383_01829 [Companilactobacillus kimchii]GEO47407.1 hypothetical protein LKI01_14060 [Companilactobacillus paralimentarius]
MPKKIAVVAMNTKKIPYVGGNELIITLDNQKVWYTANTKQIRIPFFTNVLNSMMNNFFSTFMKRSNKQDVVKANYFSKQVARFLLKNNYDQVVFENEQLRKNISRRLEKKTATVPETILA